MKTICLLGIEKTLKNSFIEYFLKQKSTIIDKNEIFISGGNFLLNFDENKNLESRKSIYLFGGLKFPKNTIIPNDSICICQSTDNDCICFLYNKNVSVITCGLSRTDTITFSSLDKKRLISLQRPIKNLGGTIIEPLEFENTISLQSDEDILLFNSLLLAI